MEQVQLASWCSNEKTIMASPLAHAMKKTFRYIFLTKGRIATVDWEDFDALSQFKWYFNNGYALRACYNPRKNVFMHRQLTETDDIQYLVDHKNRDTLDNRKENLRRASLSQNQGNRGVGRNSKSGIKGVWFYPRSGKWNAKVGKKNLGYFATSQEAAEVYAKASAQKFGEFAS